MNPFVNPFILVGTLRKITVDSFLSVDTLRKIIIAGQLMHSGRLSLTPFVFGWYAEEDYCRLLCCLVGTLRKIIIADPLAH